MSQLTEEQRLKRNAYQRQWRRTPKGVACTKRHRATPKFKANKKRYNLENGTIACRECGQRFRTEDVSSRGWPRKGFYTLCDLCND